MTDYINAYFNYVCPQCFCSLDECKCVNYPTSLIHIDRNIQQHVRILHDKGYATLYCCESHYTESGEKREIYISFAKEYGFGDRVTIPNGFHYNKQHRLLGCMIKKNLTEEQMNKVKTEKLAKLLEWCKDLPNIEPV